MSPVYINPTKITRIRTSTSFKSIIQHVAKDGCPIATLLYKALFCKRYLNPKMKFDYVSYRENSGVFSFMPYGKEQTISPDGKWAREGRQEIKPVKFAREFIHPRLISKFKDHQLAVFATKIKAFEESNHVKFELVLVDDAYNSENFYKEETLNSCMMNEPVGEFYDKFNVKALVASTGRGGWIGRALLWEEVHVPGRTETVRLMDRVYGRNEAVIELFKQWARDNSIWQKVRQSGSYFRDFYTEDGSRYDGSLTVHTKPHMSLSSVEFYPYMDTFLCGKDNNSITNSRHGYEDPTDYSFHRLYQDGEIDFVYSYRNTDGERVDVTNIDHDDYDDDYDDDY